MTPAEQAERAQLYSIWQEADHKVHRCDRAYEVAKAAAWQAAHALAAFDAAHKEER